MAGETSDSGARAKRATRARPARGRRETAAPEDYHAERLGRARVSTQLDAPGAQSLNDEGDIRRGIGRRVHELRVARGLHVKQLAEAALVTPGMISQVERGSVSPSIATLLRIAGALGAAVGDFFDAPAPAGTVVRADQRATYEWPLTGLRDELLSADRTGRLQVFWSEVKPHATSGPELLKHGSEAEFVLVISGAMEIILGDQRVLLNAGDSVTFSGDVPHGFTNPADVPAELVWVTTPATY
jgi:transcriptional regulator with XRE-family HTH domain